MRVGLFAFGTKTGLGYQTLWLYRHLDIHKTLLCDMSKSKKRPFFRQWYGPEVQLVELPDGGVPSERQIEEFLDDLDLVFVCETPLNWNLFEMARERGIRTVLQYNYEFFEHLSRKLPEPTVFAAASPWNIEKVLGGFSNVRELAVPVPGEDFPRREIVHARTFTHIAGQITAYDRNGTLDFLDAVGRIRASVPQGVRFIVYAQTITREISAAMRGKGVQLIREVPSPGDLHDRGDILVLPRRYGGMSIPARESLVAGVPVIMPDIDPNNRWMPKDWLIPAKRIHGFYCKNPVDVYGCDTVVLARMMKDLVNDSQRVQQMAAQARQLGDGMTWSVMRPAYDEFFEWVMTLEP